MKRYNELEDKMKSLSNNEKVNPPVFVWDNIEVALDKPKKKRRPLFWMLLGITFLGLAYIGISKLKHFHPETPYSSEHADENHKSEATSTHAFSENKEGQILTSSPMSDQHKNDKITESNISLPDANTDSQNANLSEFKNNPSSESVAVQNSISDAKRLISAKSSTHISFDDDADRNLNINAEILNKNFTISSNPSPVKLNERLDITSIETLSLFLKHNQELINNNNKVFCPNFSKNSKIDFFVEANGLIGTHSKNFGTGQLSTLGTERSATEHKHIGYGASLAAGMYLTNNIYIMTGLDWHNAVDKFSLEKEGLTKVIINFDINTDEPIDTSYVTGILSNTGSITYRSIDVPFTLGVRKNLDSWHLGFEIGGMFNLSYSTKGKILSKSGAVTTILDEAPVYKENLGFGFKSAIVVGKYIRDGLSIQSRLSYKNYLKDINMTSYDLPTTMQVIRLELGLRKEF